MTARRPPVNRALEICPQAPFRLDLVAAALRRQPHNAVDRWDGTCYRRIISLPAGPVEVSVRQTGATEAPVLKVDIRGTEAGVTDVRDEVGCQLRRLLGVDVSLDDFYARAATDPDLGPLALRFRGMRPPRFPDLFEALANAIACQQVSLHVAIITLNRLAETFGPAVADGHALPRAVELRANASDDDLRRLGFSRAKARALLRVAEACTTGELREAALAPLPDAEAIRHLTALPGIGRWSAEYALLRGLGRLHVFPGDDVGAQRHLAAWLDLAGRPGYDDVQAILRRWSGYAGLVYLHLLLWRLDADGDSDQSIGH